MYEYRLDLCTITDLTALGFVKHELRKTKESIKTHEGIIRKFESGVFEDSDNFNEAEFREKLSNLRSRELLLNRILEKMLKEKGVR